MPLNRLEGAALCAELPFSGDGQRLAFVNARQPKKLRSELSMIPGRSCRLSPCGGESPTLAFGPDGALAVATAAGGISLISSAGEKQSLREATQVNVRCLAWRDQGEPLLAAGDENETFSF